MYKSQLDDLAYILVFIQRKIWNCIKEKYRSLLRLSPVATNNLYSQRDVRSPILFGTS